MIRIVFLLFLVTTLAYSNSSDRVAIFQSLYSDDVSKTPQVFADYIKNVESSAIYLPLSKPDYDLPIPEFVTKEQAIEEVKLLKYLFDYGYSGTNYWEKRGVDFEGLFADMRKKISKQKEDKVAVIEIEKMLVAGFQGILDGHFSFYGKRRHGFYKHKSPYFADLLLKKESGHWIVVDSMVDGIEKGDLYLDDTGFLYPTLAPAGAQHFLLGTLSYKPVITMDLRFASGTHKLYLHGGRCGNVSTNNIYSREKIKGIDVLSVSTFNGNFHKELNQYAEAGKSLRNTGHFILNVMGNGGGSSSFSGKFVKNINDVAHWCSNSAIVMSPPVIEAWGFEDEKALPHLKDFILKMRKEMEKQKEAPLKSWTCYLAAPQKTGSYKGKAIVLANRKVASSGEATLAYFKSFEKGLLIGENSAGIGQFGEIMTYQLPHSHMVFNLPSKLFLMEGSPESRGFLPDYWLDHANPVDIVADWLNDNENFQLPLKKIETPVSYNFEQQGFPVVLKKEAGVTRPGKANVIRIDCSNGYNSKCSLLSEAEADTQRIFSLGAAIPPQKRHVKLSAMVKGENLRVEGNQFDNCYIGFNFLSKKGYQWVSKGFKGTFDWQKIEVEVELAPEDSELCFISMSAIAGKLWIDDLKFTYPE
jgi:hypothetical protein